MKRSWKQILYLCFFFLIMLFKKCSLIIWDPPNTLLCWDRVEKICSYPVPDVLKIAFFVLFSLICCFSPKNGDDRYLEPCSDIVKMVGDLLRLGVVNVDRRLVPLWTVFNRGDDDDNLHQFERNICPCSCDWSLIRLRCRLDFVNNSEDMLLTAGCSSPQW